MLKKVLIALPPVMLDLVDRIAVTECRTRSDLVREALRRYIENFKRNHGPVAIEESKSLHTVSIAQMQQPEPEAFPRVRPLIG